jgi:hypothetical protein
MKWAARWVWSDLPGAADRACSNCAGFRIDPGQKGAAGGEIG